MESHFITTVDMLVRKSPEFLGARVSAVRYAFPNQLARERKTKQSKNRRVSETGGLGYLTTAVGSLFLGGLMAGGGAVWSLTPRSPTLYRACG